MKHSIVFIIGCKYRNCNTKGNYLSVNRKTMKHKSRPDQDLRNMIS